MTKKKENKLFKKLWKLNAKADKILRQFGASSTFHFVVRGPVRRIEEKVQEPPLPTTSKIAKFNPLPKELRKLTPKQKKIEKKLDKLQKKFKHVLKKEVVLSEARIKQLLKERLEKERESTAKLKAVDTKIKNKIKKRKKKADKEAAVKKFKKRCQQEGCKNKEYTSSRTKDLIACTDCSNAIFEGWKMDTYNGYSPAKKKRIKEAWDKAHPPKESKKKKKGKK